MQFSKTYSPIGNREISSKPIANSQLVDLLLEDYKTLITPSYKKWFAKRFYTLSPELIAQLASEAKTDGKNPRKLFTHLIGKNCG